MFVCKKYAQNQWCMIISSQITLSLDISLSDESAYKLGSVGCNH